MPELPEVETVRARIEPFMHGKKISKLEVFATKLRFQVPTAKLRKIGESGRVHTVTRHGKYLRILFPAGEWVVHLGMSGNFHLTKPDSKHIHVIIHIGRKKLFYTDPRRFGFFDAVYTNESNPHLCDKGLDAILEPVQADQLFQWSRKRKSSIKAFLLNQNVLSGIGNIYASEILFSAKISPRKKTSALNRQQCIRLSASIQEILQSAIQHGGTTFDSFRTPDGKSGDHFKQLAVYNKAGIACKNCHTEIRQITQQNRSSYYCPTCQTS